MRELKHHWTIVIALLVALSACEQSPQFDAVPQGATALAFGDSVTYGVGASSGEDFPALLAADTGWNVINAGVSGDTAKEAKHRIGALLAQHQPQLVIVELGGNDFLRRRSSASVKQDLREIIDLSLASGATTVLIGVPELSVLRSTMGALIDAPIYKELAQETDAILVSDIFSEVLSDDDLKADEIHPNARGYAVFTAGLVERLTAVGLLH